MDAVAVIHTIGGQIQSPRAQRVGRPAGLALFPFRKLGVALDHFWWRRPFRPMRAVGDVGHTCPLEARAADSDAVAQRGVFAVDVIEVALGRRDDDGADRFGAVVCDLLHLEFRRHFFDWHRWHRYAAIGDACIMQRNVSWHRGLCDTRGRAGKSCARHAGCECQRQSCRCQKFNRQKTHPSAYHKMGRHRNAARILL